MAQSPVYILEDQETITNTLINYFRTAQTIITDFNEGAEARNLLESVGISFYMQRFLIDYMMNMGVPHTAEGNYLDMIGILVNCKRKQAVQAEGTLVFSIPNERTTDYIIPSGTQLSCSTDSSLYFESVGDITIAAGNTSVTAQGIASIGGSNGNVVAGMIDTINDSMFEVSVTNPNQFTKGCDTELDDPFRERILESGKGKITGSVSWYKKESANIVGVHDASVVDTPLVPIHDMVLYVNGNTQPTPDDVIQEVTELFEQEDHKIGGITILVNKPTFITQNLVISVQLKPGQSWDAIHPILEQDLICYFKGGTTSYGASYVGLNNNETLVLSVLQMIIVNSLGTTFLDYTITTPTTNVPADVDEAIMLGTITLTQVV
jgi:uncharacterized phage protein gp47/JayE